MCESGCAAACRDESTFVTNLLKYFCSLLSYTDSHAATTTPLYGTLMLDRAIVDCFLLLHEIDPLASENINLVVDLLSNALLTQSAFVNPSTQIGYLPCRRYRDQVFHWHMVKLALFQEINLLPSENINHVVDLLSNVLLTQSASVNP